MSKVIIIDDNQSVVSALQLLLELHEIRCCSAQSAEEAIIRIQGDDDIHLAIQDMNFCEGENSGEKGRKLFYQIRELREDLPIILFTAWAQLEMAVELIKEGAADYISKPWDDQKLILTIHNLLELGRLQAEHRQRALAKSEARFRLGSDFNLCGIVYQSDAMHALLELATKIARSDVSVMITGPNGSGKEKIAHIIQANSAVKSGPFVKLNVGALPNELIEAELFGAEAGAYSGITKTRKGRFELADGGTLFLDELGNLSSSGQAKLLRVLQTGEFEKLGSSTTQKCNVRLISATNSNLLDDIRSGKFREDLYYRLNVIELKLLPLRERPEDILPLLNYFVDEDKTLPVSVVSQLQKYAWPGNVRELENACKRACLVAEREELTIDDFGLTIVADQETNLRKREEPNKQMIEFVMRENRGVIASAARQLGMSRQSLYRRLEKYDIHHE